MTVTRFEISLTALKVAETRIRRSRTSLIKQKIVSCAEERTMDDGDCQQRTASSFRPLLVRVMRYVYVVMIDPEPVIKVLS